MLQQIEPVSSFDAFFLVDETVEGIWFPFKDGQLANASFPNDFTDGGIDIFFSLLHPWKANSPIEVTEEGTFISGNAKQHLMVELLIEVKEEGSSTFFNEEHNSKAPSPICFKVGGINTSFNL